MGFRNHEVTQLKIKHIRLRKKYGEGEIPHESKTGTGPSLQEVNDCDSGYDAGWNKYCDIGLAKHPDVAARCPSRS